MCVASLFLSISAELLKKELDGKAESLSEVSNQKDDLTKELTLLRNEKSSMKEHIEELASSLSKLQEEKDEERKTRVAFEMRLVDFEDYRKHTEVDVVSFSLTHKPDDCICVFVDCFEFKQCFLVECSMWRTGRENLTRLLWQVSMNKEIEELKIQTDTLQKEVQEGEGRNVSLEQEKVSLEMRMAEMEEQKEGKKNVSYFENVFDEFVFTGKH